MRVRRPERAATTASMCDAGQRGEGCAAPAGLTLTVAPGGSQDDGRPENGLLGGHAQMQGY
jgi:hypothetical protein